MSALIQLQENLPNLSRNERRVADFILDHSRELQKLSGEAISAACNTSRSTVLRLCQKLGYQGYAEFKYAILYDLENSNYVPPAASNVFAEQPAQNTVSYYCTGLMQMEGLVDSKVIREIVDAISYANRVISMGLLHSSVSAEQLAFRLNKFGIDCHALNDDTLMASYERILRQGDVAVIFSISGRDFYAPIVSEYRKNRVKVILVTMSPECALAKDVDIVLPLPYLTNISGMYPMDEAIIFFMLIEILIEALNKKLQGLID